MFRVFLLLLIPNICFAQASFWESSVDWLKGQVEGEAIVDFDKHKFQFDGFKETQAQLNIFKPLGKDFSLHTLVEIKRQNLETGVCKKKLSSYAYEFMPRLHLANNLLIGIGMRKFVSGELQFGPDQYITLESGRAWVVSALLSEIGADSSMELRLSATSIKANKFSPMEQKAEFTDNSLKLVYRSHF